MYYGLADRTDFARVTDALLASPEYRLEYRHGDGYVFRYVGGKA
jgi:hypothetical protein